SRERNIITSLHIQSEKMEVINKRLQEKYRVIREQEVRYQTVHVEDAEILLVGYGLSARVCHRAVELARHHGIAAGLLRPITLFPYPTEIVHTLAQQVEKILVVEMNSGQMVEDVRLAVEGAVPVEFFGRMGGIIPSPEEVLAKLVSMMKTEQQYEVSHV
ncbi:MAG TPA: transketolase C-terminal domain-containing protein, partial [Bacteroidota bacterium]|nr:transketolase C-terminal domain-containing protein [Bacteroidota bacterium]